MRRRFALLFMLLCASFTFAQAEVPVLRVAAPPAIDGEGGEWSGPPTVHLRDRAGKASLRLAADGTALYALIAVEDTSPLKNGAASAEEAIGSGDVVALCFGSKADEAQRIAVTRRQDKLEVLVYRMVSATKRPHTFRSPVGEAAFDYVGPLAEALVSCRTRDGGYTVELALPWKALGFDAAPERFGFDAQLFFSDPGGTQTVGLAWLSAGNGASATIEDLPSMARLQPDTWSRAVVVDSIGAPAATAASAPAALSWIDVELAKPGRLSLNLVDERGWILRELVMAETFAAGRHRIAWDGRDRYGEPLPPGTYRWQALRFDGMRTHFMGSIGNSGRPPYRTPDGLGSMGGQHGVQKSVAADEGGIYMANALQEGPPVMRKIDAATGRALWMRSAGGFQSIDAIAAAEGLACIVHSQGKRGDYACELIRIDPATGQDVDMANGSSRVPLPLAQGRDQVADLAIVANRAWIALPEKNRIAVVNLLTGKPEAELEIETPLGLARLDERTLLVCAGDRVLAVDVESRAITTRLEGLEAPRAVAVDAAGSIFVSELGSSQRLRQYAAGKLVATWGKAGGKSNQQIPYDPLAFRNVTGIAVGPDGNLWLAESDGLVKRVVKLSPKGEWLEDFYGPVAYNAFGPDLDDFSTLYYTITGGCFNEVAIDYAQYQRDPLDPAKAWRIRAIHDLGLGADGETVNELMRNVAKTGYGHVIAFRADNGQRYFFRLSKLNRASAPPGAGLWIERDGRWVPCAFIARDTKQYTSWADANGDGLIQPEERYAGLPISEAAWIDRDLTLHGYEGRLAPASFTAAGAPVYVDGAFRPWLAEGEPSYRGNQWTFFSRGDGDTVYTISNHGPHRHLSFWDRATENRLVKIGGGKVQWIAGKHAAKPAFVEFGTSSGIAGALDGVVLVQNVEPANYVAYTDDGFVLGDIMVDEDGKHPSVGPFVINIESFTGLYLKDPKTGRNVLFAVSSGDNRILDVTGPGETERFGGTVDLRPSPNPDPHPDPHPAPVAAPSFAIPYSTWYGNTYNGLGVDGEDSEWRPDVRSVSLQTGGATIADVRLRRDAGNLYIFASVLDPRMTAGSGLTMVLADAPDGGVRYTLALPLQRRDDGRWTVAPALSRRGEPVTAKIEAALTERWLGLGYRVEIGLSLAALPELAAPREQTYRRRVPDTREIGSITEALPDLRGSLFLDVQVRRNSDAAALASDGLLRPVELPNE